MCLKLRAKATTLEADVRAFKDKKVWNAAQRTSAIETVLALIGCDFQVWLPLRFIFLSAAEPGSRLSHTPPIGARANPTPEAPDAARRPPKGARRENVLEEPPTPPPRHEGDI